MAGTKQTKQGKPGPKSRGPYEYQRQTLTTRVTDGMRTKIDDAAARNDRSLSQEVEFRLEQSFRDELFMEAAYGDRHLREVFRTVALGVEALERQTGKKWADDRETFDQVGRVFLSVLSGLGLKPVTGKAGDVGRAAGQSAVEMMGLTAKLMMPQPVRIGPNKGKMRKP